MTSRWRASHRWLRGDSPQVVIAGPCAIESSRQILLAPPAVAGAGANLLRGDAFKPRAPPYSFQGLGGLEPRRGEVADGCWCGGRGARPAGRRSGGVLRRHDQDRHAQYAELPAALRGGRSGKARAPQAWEGRHGWRVARHRSTSRREAQTRWPWSTWGEGIRRLVAQHARYHCWALAREHSDLPVTVDPPHASGRSRLGARSRSDGGRGRSPTG